MADVTVTVAAKGTAQATSAMRKVGDAADQMAKKTNRAESSGRGGNQKNSGYAILEVSRGIEDFSMAGMRGLLNNIPQMLLFAGVAPQLAAAVSLIAVAGYIAGPKLLTFKKAIEESEKAAKKAETMAASLKVITDSIKAMDFKDWAQGQAAAVKSEMDGVSDAISAPMKKFEEFSRLQSEQTSNQDRLRAAQNRVADLERKPESEGGVSQDSVNIGRDVEASKRESDALAEQLAKLTQAREELAKAEADANATNPETKEGFVSAEQIKEEKVALMTRIEFLKRTATELEETKKKLEESSSGFMGAAKGGSGDFGNAIRQTAANLALTSDPGPVKDWGIKTTLALSDSKSGFAVMEKKNKLAREAVDLNKKSLAAAEEEMKRFEDKVKIQEDALTTSDELTSKATEEREALEKQLDTLREKLRYSELITKENEKAAKTISDKEAEKWMESLNKLAGSSMLDVSNLISSQGRSGGAANESNAALGMISYQRDANKHLAGIERNTRRNVSIYQ